MFAKIAHGNSFSGCFNYITRKKLDDEPGEKVWKILDSDGVRISEDEKGWRNIASSDIKRPTLTRSKIKEPCGHIALGFSPEDAPRMTDKFMAEIAREYMEKMGLTDTPYVIVRHNDTDHPHCHLMFSRVNYDGKIIKSSSNFSKNKSVCLDITERHGLTMGTDSMNIDTSKLRGSEKSRVEIRQIANEVLKDKSVNNWAEFQKRLAERGVGTKPLFTDEPEPKLKTIVYKSGRHSFVASKIGKRFTPNELQREFSKRLNQSRANAPTPSNRWVNPDGLPKAPDSFNGVKLTAEQKRDYVNGHTIRVDSVYIRFDLVKKEPQVSHINPDMTGEHGYGLPFHPGASQEYVDFFAGLGRWDKEEFKRFRRRHPTLTNQEAIRMFRTEHNLSQGMRSHL